MKGVASPITARYVAEIKTLIGRRVEVYTSQGRRYRGSVSALNPETLTLVLSNAVDLDKDVEYPLVVINGSSVSEVLLAEHLFDLRSLAERLEKYFPRMVRYDEVARVIVVAGTVKVGEDGIIEGTGPIAERVRSIYEEYLREVSGG